MTVSTGTAAPPARPSGAALRKLTLTEAKLFVREPMVLVWTVVFPPLLLVILGSIPSFRRPDADLGGQRLIELYVPIMIAFVLAMTAVNLLPATLTLYREKGILRRLSTTPLSPSALMLAQVIVNLVAQLVVLILVLGIGRIAFGVPLPRQVPGYIVAYLLTLAALFGIGLCVAALARTGKAANAVGMVLFFPMMFFAGLWLPRAAMPALLRHISDATPLGAAVQALQDATAGHWPHALPLGVLAAYAVVTAVVAARFFRWD